MNPHAEYGPIHCGGFKELHQLENPDVEVQMTITPRFEVEKVIWHLSGKLLEENKAEHDLNIQGELSFV